MFFFSRKTIFFFTFFLLLKHYEYFFLTAFSFKIVALVSCLQNPHWSPSVELYLVLVVVFSETHQGKSLLCLRLLFLPSSSPALSPFSWIGIAQ